MSYDLIIIGAGPGGYVCAIRASQLGLKTAVIEKRRTLGGTCANVGCIPSKALLHATELFEEAGHGFAAFGIEIPKPKLNLTTMMKHKADTVASNVGGVAMLMKKNKVDTHYGTGAILGAGKVEVTADDGKKTTLETKSIVIATGSDAAQLRGGDGQMIAFDEKIIVSSTGALELPKVPGHLVVVGAGVIGLELGSVWKRLGAKVAVVEFTGKCLGGMDAELGGQFQRLMEKQGMVFHMSSKVTKVEKAAAGVKVSFEPVAGGAATTLDCDVVLIATGRVPYTTSLGLEQVGVTLDRGRVVINDHFETNVPGIYAIGDVVRGAMLAHKAEEEGVALAERLTGQAGHVNYDVIPGVVYTYPEVAAVGRTCSWPTAGRAPTAPPTASSRCWRTLRPTACSACTSSAPAPVS
jgi:dihydrolipoamide dehydrogenase